MKTFVNGMDKAGEWIDKISCVILTALMVGMFLIVMINIASRSILGKSLPWSSELAPYLMVWASFLGSSVACKRKMHVAIDALIVRFKGIPARIAYAIMYALIIIALVVFTYAGAMQTAAQLHQYSITMHFSVAYIYASMPVSGVLMLYYTVLHMLQYYVYGEGVTLNAAGI